MRIEEEIKSAFKDDYHKALVNIIYTHNFLIDRMNAKFKEMDVTRQQFNVLRILRGQYPQPAPISLIKDRMLDKMSDASRIVDRLVKKGLILKRSNDQDRRAVDILISDKGIKLLNDYEEEADAFTDLVRGLKPKEVGRLNELLDKIRDNEKN